MKQLRAQPARKKRWPWKKKKKKKADKECSVAKNGPVAAAMLERRVRTGRPGRDTSVVVRVFLGADVDGVVLASGRGKLPKKNMDIERDLLVVFDDVVGLRAKSSESPQRRVAKQKPTTNQEVEHEEEEEEAKKEMALAVPS